MTREQLTLYGDDAEWFRSIKQEIADQRAGNEPSNAETARLMMQGFESERNRL